MLKEKNLSTLISICGEGIFQNLKADISSGI